MAVYVVQEIFKRSRENQLVPQFNLKPARKYGDLKILLPPGQVMLHPIPMVRELEKGLRTFNDDDYLLPIGDPSAVATAAVIAAKKNGGRFKMLKWDRRDREYNIVEIQT